MKSVVESHPMYIETKKSCPKSKVKKQKDRPIGPLKKNQQDINKVAFKDDMPKCEKDN